MSCGRRCFVVKVPKKRCGYRITMRVNVQSSGDVFLVCACSIMKPIRASVIKVKKRS